MDAPAKIVVAVAATPDVGGRGELVTLTVGDDGVGIPDDLDLLHTETLGLQLVRPADRQVHGTLAIQRHDPTRFFDRIPGRA